MEAIIEVQNLTKDFLSLECRPHRNLKARLVRIFGRRKRISEGPKTRRVLENISFKIYPGEFVGLMGRNGIGKSTILKIMSGIYAPTMGTVVVRGAVAPLLELGAGFELDLSGFENILLNSAILGYSRAQTMRKLEQIISFSELEAHIHRPVRTYSSGMIMRLGFSVAAHLDAPVIFLDEVLGVGDAAFSKKSVEKILELHSQGRTIILVTHNPKIIAEFCTRGIVLDHKQVVFDGPAVEIEEHYNRAVFSPC